MARADTPLRLVEQVERPATEATAYAGRMYAIAFDMDTKVMKETCGKPSYENGYTEIENVLRAHGFTKQQGSVYFGDRDTVRAVSCVIAVQDLAQQLPWFGQSVRDIRMLRIEEEDDLRVAIEKVEPAPSTGHLFDVAKVAAQVASQGR